MMQPGDDLYWMVDMANRSRPDVEPADERDTLADWLEVVKAGFGLVVVVLLIVMVWKLS